MQKILLKLLPAALPLVIAAAAPYAEAVQHWISDHPIAAAVSGGLGAVINLFLPQPHKGALAALQKAQSHSGRR